jgi:NAD(P)-dependent dehydrogenase (short-subunit alcohol dehydrogenase family)
MPTVLITGANRGLGLEFARQYAADGWRVIATCREPARAPELARLAAGHPKLAVHALDVTSNASVRALAQTLGEAPIDVLINNAGVAGPSGQGLGRIDYAGWLQALEINTLGPTRVCEAFVEQVARSDRKLIVSITSGMGSIGDSSGGAYVYRSSKAALNMVMHNVALDLRPRGVICVVINPGWVKTDMGTERAPLTPAESITAMRKIFDGLTLEDTGKFLNWRGGTYEW